MKKLKLNLSEMAGAEMLTRDQLKQVMGGDDGSDGSSADFGFYCLTASCTLYVQGDNGDWVPRNGDCAADMVATYAGWVFHGCFCSTGLGNVPISSNGGSSRCSK